MGLGVEKFDQEDIDKWGNGIDWAPSTVPYVIEELIQSSECETAEWYRMTTLWSAEWDQPRSGYIWRTRNPKGDTRVQTNIIGGAYCVTSKHTPFVGPGSHNSYVMQNAANCKGKSYDPRTNLKVALDPNVENALETAIDFMIEMHTTLGQELYTIGWDVMVRDGKPLFLEFNINNGFFLADHSVDEAYTMAAYYEKEFFARLDAQVLNFDTNSKS